MKVERNELMNYTQFIEECAEKELVENCIKALNYYYEGYNIDKYFVIDIEGYLCITRSIALTKTMAVIKDEVIPFDNKKVYPRQVITKKYCFKY